MARTENRDKRVEGTMQKALVIGSEGTIGKKLVERLRQKNYEVYRADRLIKSEPDYFICDIKEFETLHNMFKMRPDVVFHLAAEAGRLMADNCPSLSIQSNSPFQSFLN